MSAHELCAQLAFSTDDGLSEQTDRHGLQCNSVPKASSWTDSRRSLQSLPVEIMLLIAENNVNGALYFVGRRWLELLYRDDKDVDERRIHAASYCAHNDDLAKTEWNDSHGRLRWLLKQPWLMATHFTAAYIHHVDGRVRNAFENFFDMHPISTKRLRKRVRPRFEQALKTSFIHTDTFVSEFTIRGSTTDKGSLAFVVSRSDWRRGGMFEVNVDIGLGESTAYLPQYRRPDLHRALARVRPPAVCNYHTLPLSLLRGPWDTRVIGVIDAFVFWFWSGRLPLPLSERQLDAAADGLQATIEGSVADALRFLPSTAAGVLRLVRARDLLWDSQTPWEILTSVYSDGLYLPVPIQARHIRKFAHVAFRSSEDAKDRYEALEMIAAYLSLDAQFSAAATNIRQPQAGSISHDDCSHLLSEFQLIASAIPDGYMVSQRHQLRKHFIPSKRHDSEMARLQAGVARATLWLKSGHLDVDLDDETWKERKVHDEPGEGWASQPALKEPGSVSPLACENLSPYRALPLRSR